AIAHATALIVALMIDPDAAQRSRSQGSEAPSSSAVPTASDEARPRSTGPRRAATSAPSTGVPPRKPQEQARQTRIRFRAGLLAALDVGTLPSAAPGGGVSVSLLSGASSIRAEAIRWARSSTTITHTDPSMGGQFDLLSVSLAGCPGLGLGRFEMGLCAEAELDWLKGTGTGIDIPDHKTFRWLSVGAGGVADVRLGSGLRMNAQVDLLVPLARSKFVLEGVAESGGEVHRPGPAAGRAGVGFGYVF
ncbi:MAG: hypothetical protein JW940_22230, partial [Polyangiaceae bacterium]|nr:hypothetical protein [Polyangiaceae bacterium]